MNRQELEAEVKRLVLSAAIFPQNIARFGQIGFDAHDLCEKMLFIPIELKHGSGIDMFHTVSRITLADMLKVCISDITTFVVNRDEATKNVLHEIVITNPPPRFCVANTINNILDFDPAVSPIEETSGYSLDTNE